MTIIKLGCSWREANPVRFQAAKGAVTALFKKAVERTTASENSALAVAGTAAGGAAASLEDPPPAGTTWALAFVAARRGCVEVDFVFIADDDALLSAVLALIEGGFVRIAEVRLTAC